MPATSELVAPSAASLGCGLNGFNPASRSASDAAIRTPR